MSIEALYHHNIDQGLNYCHRTLYRYHRVETSTPMVVIKALMAVVKTSTLMVVIKAPTAVVKTLTLMVVIKAPMAVVKTSALWL